MEALTMTNLPGPSSRRGTALAAILIVLALVGISVVAVVSAWGDLAAADATRAQGVRARYATESAAAMATRLLIEGDEVPAGTLSLDGHAWFAVQQTAETTDTHELTIASGTANLTRTEVVPVRID
jgi:type II secretory pathway component PulK